MAVTCKNCGGAHAIWECKRPATKSTGGVTARSAAEGRQALPASTVHLPVDTNPPQGSKGLSDDGREVTLQRPVEVLPGNTNGKTKDHRDHSGPVPELEGTPVRVQSPPSSPPKFDKKAWSRAYMKIWMRNKRAKLKLERENAK